MSYELRAKLADTHCHLDFPEFDADRKEVIAAAKEQGLGYIVNIGSSIAGSKKSWELAQEYDFIYAAIGLHPHEADGFNPQDQIVLEDLARKDKVVAIGETGLDYYKNYSKAENQKTLFKFLVGLAKDSGLPLVIHNRQAQGDTLEILKQAQAQRCVVHCFSQDEVFLKECLDLGFFISFTCNITYRNADNLRNLVKLTPLDRLFLETDAPFLPPQGLRGRRNEPVYVRYLCEEIARIKEIDIEEVARTTTNNAKAFFNLP